MEVIFFQQIFLEFSLIRFFSLSLPPPHTYINKRMHAYKGFPGGSVVKKPPAMQRDAGLIPGSERSPGEGNGNPL